MKNMPENDCPECGFELCDKHDAEFMARMRELNPPRKTRALMTVERHKKETQRLQAEVGRLEAESSELYRQKELEIGRANWAEGRAESAEACLSEIRALIAGYEDGLGDLVVRDITKVLHREADSG